MLIVAPIGPGGAAYYFRGQEAGTWIGAGGAALGLAGDVKRADLVSVLRGCHPRERRYLPDRKPPRRRGGWDLTLAAPKSVSLLAALSADGGEAVAVAHSKSVVDMLAEMETRYLASGAIAAAFRHRTNAAGEPHLHTHLVLANLARTADGGWSALNRDWWTARRALGATYQLGLRHHLAAGGFELDWRLRDDGLADLADVPRAAIRAASSRRLAAVADQARFAGDQMEGPVRAGVRHGGRVRTRSAATADSHPQWLDGSTAAGFGAGDARRLTAIQAGGRPPHTTVAAGELHRAVTARLASWRSAFRHRDVVVALAGCWPAGCTAAAAGEWADRYCEASIAVPVRPGMPPRWTTVQARDADRRLRQRLEAVDAGPARLGREAVQDSAARYRLAPVAREALERLVSSEGRLAVLSAEPGRSNFLAHAALLEAAAATWEAGARRVAVETSSPREALRWRALTGIEPFAASGRADIVIIDHVDRRTSAEMLAVLARIERIGAVPVLVEGGTRPRLGWMRSDAVAAIAAGSGRLDPGPAPAWTPWPADPVARGLDRVVTHRPRGDPLEAGGLHAGAGAAAGALLARWAEVWSAPVPPVLVGLGPPEVDGLNQGARAILAANGRIGGPAIRCRGRPIQEGDRLLALRRTAAVIAPGTVLTVRGVDARRNRLHLQWGRERAVLDPRDAGALGYAYAASPAVASRLANPLLVLGAGDTLGRLRERVVMQCAARPLELATPGRELTGRSRA
jgi:conjugative relaxase-like TrwC/TraI family protein